MKKKEIVKEAAKLAIIASATALTLIAYQCSKRKSAIKTEPKQSIVERIEQDLAIMSTKARKYRHEVDSLAKVAQSLAASNEVLKTQISALKNGKPKKPKIVVAPRDTSTQSYVYSFEYDSLSAYSGRLEGTLNYYEALSDSQNMAIYTFRRIASSSDSLCENRVKALGEMMEANEQVAEYEQKRAKKNGIIKGVIGTLIAVTIALIAL